MIGARTVELPVRAFLCPFTTYFMKNETNQSPKKPPFIRVDYAIACIPDINSTDKLILGYILNYKTPGGCYQRLGGIARIIGMSEDTVSKSVTKLIRMGYLTPEQHPTARRYEVFKRDDDEDDEPKVSPLVPHPNPVVPGPKGVGCTPNPVDSDPKGFVLDPQTFPGDPKGVGFDPTPLESITPDLPMKTGELLDSKPDSSLRKESDHNLEKETNSLQEDKIPKIVTVDLIKQKLASLKQMTMSECIELQVRRSKSSTDFYNNGTQNVEGINDTNASGASPGNSLDATQGSGPAASSAAASAPPSGSGDVFDQLFN